MLCVREIIPTFYKVLGFTKRCLYYRDDSEGATKGCMLAFPAEMTGRIQLGYMFILNRSTVIMITAFSESKSV